MLETLLAFSLVKRLSEDQQLSIHRLVQVVQLERLSSEEQRQWAERIVLAVSALFPPDPAYDVASWPQCLRYLEQVQACDALIQQHQLLLPEAADMLDRTGAYLASCDLPALAEPLFRQALRIWELQWGPEHVEMAWPLNNLANLYTILGKYAQAEPLYQRALRIWEQLGLNHQLVSHPLNGLGNLYSEQGKYAQAEECYQRALSTWEQQLGTEHVDVASPLGGLGNIYSAQGKYEKAKPLYQRALSIREQQLGAEHPETAEIVHGLARFWEMQGNLEEARMCYSRALAIREQALGTQHPRARETRTRLIALLHTMGEHENATHLEVAQSE